MTILSNGYRLPQTGDFGNVWFPALEFNIQQTNDHTHDGLNGERISSINLVTTGSTLTVTSGSFADQGNGYFRSTVTVPGGGAVDNYVVTVKDPTTKEPIFLKMEKLTATTFYLYTNFVQNFELYFGV